MKSVRDQIVELQNLSGRIKHSQRLADIPKVASDLAKATNVCLRLALEDGVRKARQATGDLRGKRA
jgi:hypothetical protein